MTAILSGDVITLNLLHWNNLETVKAKLTEPQGKKLINWLSVGKIERYII